MSTVIPVSREHGQGRSARRQMPEHGSRLTLLLMRRQERQARWPYERFNALLDSKMLAAGIPITSRGRPSSVVFEEITGIGNDRLSRWRSGYQQPTTDSLRDV